MKIPFTTIHIKPKFLVSHVKQYFGDSVPVCGKRNLQDGVETGYFRNLRKISDSVFIETGDAFPGVLIGDNIETAESRY